MALLFNRAVRAATAPRQLIEQQKRYRSKINIQRPQKLFHERALVTELATPFYPPTVPPAPLWEKCTKLKKKSFTEQEPHPYQRIIARECLERFNASKMIAFLHKNSIKAEGEFEFAVALKKVDMKVKYYGSGVIRLALQGTQYEATLPLFRAPGLIIFSPESNVPALQKILKKVPQVILMAGILDGKLLNLTDFIKYGNMSITDARSELVHTMQMAGGINLNRQLTHHQTTLVSRLQQIAKNEGTSRDNDFNSEETNADGVKPE